MRFSATRLAYQTVVALRRRPPLATGLMASSQVTCKWCGRSKEDAQPLRHLAELHPKLLWRRKDGRECSICPLVISSDAELKKVGKKELEDQLLGNEAKRKKFRAKVQAYEDSENSAGGARKAPSGARQSLTARQVGMAESRRLLGYLWPTS